MLLLLLLKVHFKKTFIIYLTNCKWGKNVINAQQIKRPNVAALFGLAHSESLTKKVSMNINKAFIVIIIVLLEDGLLW